MLKQLVGHPRRGGIAAVTLVAFVAAALLLIAQGPKAEVAVEQAALKAAAAEEGSVTTPSGVVVLRLREGTGKPPTYDDTVVIRYTAAFLNGTVFKQQDAPAPIPMKYLIWGVSDGLAQMKPGGKAKLTIPARLNKGTTDAAGKLMSPLTTMVYNVDLYTVQPGAPFGR